MLALHQTMSFLTFLPFFEHSQSFIKIFSAEAWSKPEGFLQADISEGKRGEEVLARQKDNLETDQDAMRAESEAYKSQLAESVLPADEQAARVSPAEEETDKTAQIPEEERAEGKKFITDTIHGYISEGVLASAIWLDSFFDDPRFELEENRTRIKLRLENFFDDDLGNDFTTRVNAKIVLPRMKRKAKLIISGDQNEDLQSDSATGSTAAERFSTTDEQNLTTSLQYFFEAAKRHNLSARTGLRWRNDSVQAFISPRYRLLHELDSWAFRLTEEVLWWTDIGWQSKTQFDLERPFGNQWFLRMTADGFWTEEKNGYFYGLGMLVRQPLSQTRVLEYEWNNFFITSPIHYLEEILLRIRYRQKVWRDWLFLELAPQARFPRQLDYDFTPGILLRLELIFGWY